MDTVKKDKHGFNFVDAVIILVVIAAIVLLAKIFFFRSERGGEMVDIYYAVECLDINPKIAYDMKPGELFFESEKGYRMGEGIDFVVGDKESILQAADGHVVATNQPNLRSVIVILSATVEKKTYEYIADNYYSIQVGQEFRISSPSFAGYGYCVALTEVNSEQDKTDFVKKAKELVYIADVHVDEPETEGSANE